MRIGPEEVNSRLSLQIHNLLSGVEHRAQGILMLTPISIKRSGSFNQIALDVRTGKFRLYWIYSRQNGDEYSFNNTFIIFYNMFSLLMFQ